MLQKCTFVEDKKTFKLWKDNRWSEWQQRFGKEESVELANIGIERSNRGKNASLSRRSSVLMLNSVHVQLSS